MSSDPASPGRTTPKKGKGRREVQAEVPRPKPVPAEPEAPPPSEPAAVQIDPQPRERCNVLMLSFLSLFVIGFGVWLVSAGKRYREEYAEATEGWRVGSTRVVELTLVKDDKRNLACASDQVIAGLQCGYQRDYREVGPTPPEERQVLRPYNTVKNELLLGAGLWSSTDLEEPLPQRRFTVVCNYHVEGIMKSAAIRFDPKGSFAPLGKTVTVGTLTDCVRPR